MPEVTMYFLRASAGLATWIHFSMQQFGPNFFIVVERSTPFGVEAHHLYQSDAVQFVAIKAAKWPTAIQAFSRSEIQTKADKSQSSP